MMTKLKPPVPPTTVDLKYGQTLIAGLGESQVVAVLDFETYSEAGYEFKNNKWDYPGNANSKGLALVGQRIYAMHPSTEVLCLAYDLKDGREVQQWIPGQPLPVALFEHLRAGKLLSAWNVSFEYNIWKEVCEKKYGFPDIDLYKNQLRCTAAKSRAFSLPGHLADAGVVLNILRKKFDTGKRLIEKFSIPRSPTKKDSRLRIHLTNLTLINKSNDDSNDTLLMFDYNKQDCRAESEISAKIPDLSDDELKFWQIDQLINQRGVQVDMQTVDKAIQIINKIYEKYTHELTYITDGEITSVNMYARISRWAEKNGVQIQSLNKAGVTELLKLKKLPDKVRRVLEIREFIGGAAVKKLHAIKNRASKDGRVYDLFIYHGAHTGRASGAGVQPQNLPNYASSKVRLCECSRYHNSKHNCPWCGSSKFEIKEWNREASKDAIEIINTGDFNSLEYFFNDGRQTISDCLRSLFISKPGHKLICSDFQAIEAVVLAALAKEEWRLDVFNTHAKNYEMSASKISGVSFDEIINHKKNTGSHHPLRKLGKVAELASGYGGWVGAWVKFKADEFLSVDEIKNAILAWRKENPKIVEFWGGQMRGRWKENYGIEGAAINAILNPSRVYEYNGINFIYLTDILYCILPSGRKLTYHKALLNFSQTRPDTLEISYEGWSTNPVSGAKGWKRMTTYGGKLTENIVQAVSRDILANAILNLEKAGYPVVLHIHDEIVCEIPDNFGSIAEFEKIMGTLPKWADGWPVKATGGWIDDRYGK